MQKIEFIFVQHAQIYEQIDKINIITTIIKTNLWIISYCSVVSFDTKFYIIFLFL